MKNNFSLTTNDFVLNQNLNVSVKEIKILKIFFCKKFLDCFPKFIFLFLSVFLLKVPHCWAVTLDPAPMTVSEKVDWSAIIVVGRAIWYGEDRSRSEYFGPYKIAGFLEIEIEKQLYPAKKRLPKVVRVPVHEGTFFNVKTFELYRGKQLLYFLVPEQESNWKMFSFAESRSIAFPEEIEKMDEVHREIKRVGEHNLWWRSFMAEHINKK